MRRGSKRQAPAQTFPTARALATHLEARWFQLSVEDNWLVVRPARWLTDADRSHIREHRDALVHLIQETPATTGGLRFTPFDPTQACDGTVH